MHDAIVTKSPTIHAEWTRKLCCRLLVVIMICGLSSISLFAAGGKQVPQEPDKLAKAKKAVEGKWVRRVRTADGIVTIEKTHKAGATTFTARDAADKILSAKTSEYHIEQSEKLFIFTYFNNTATAGPGIGQTDNQPNSFVFRATDKRFIEVHGLLETDTINPTMLIWEKANGD